MHTPSSFNETEAAKLLGVPQSFLLSLLESGQLPCVLHGTERRIDAQALLAFKSQRDADRRRALDDLSRSEVEAGTYDLAVGYDTEGP